MDKKDLPDSITEYRTDAISRLKNIAELAVECEPISSTTRTVITGKQGGCGRFSTSVYIVSQPSGVTRDWLAPSNPTAPGIAPPKLGAENKAVANLEDKNVINSTFRILVNYFLSPLSRSWR